MRVNTPGNFSHYTYTAEETFDHPQRLARGFTMKDYSILMHRQEFFEINIVVKGSGEHYVGNGLLPADTGDVFIIPPGLEHGYVGGKGFDVYHLVLSPVFIEKYSADLRKLPSFMSLFKVEPAMREHFLSRLHLSLNKEQLSELMPLLDSISRESVIDSLESAVITTNLSMILIVRLCGLYDGLRREVGEADSMYSDESFMTSISYIYENYYTKISIDKLAEMAHMSRSSYLKKFKDFTGNSPGMFIMKQRCEAASVMLTSTALSVGEIALETGFYDTPHLVRIFREHYGISPLEYRKANKS